jgi:membrane-associated protease RseP (regulator of RpoE activity)
VREGALQLGMVLLGALMIFVVFNDIVRIAGG